MKNSKESDKIKDKRRNKGRKDDTIGHVTCYYSWIVKKQIKSNILIRIYNNKGMTLVLLAPGPSD